MSLISLDYCETTLKLKQSLEQSFLELGQRLMKIRDESLYSPQWTSFPEYLHEMKMSEATASKLINIYKRFSLEWNFPTAKLVEAGGWSVVATLLPVVKTREEAEAWLDKAQVLSRPDLERDIKELKTGLFMKDCVHEDYYILKVCRTCGDRMQVHEENQNQT